MKKRERNIFGLITLISISVSSFTLMIPLFVNATSSPSNTDYQILFSDSKNF